MRAELLCRHNLDHILYNMLVKVYEADPSIRAQQVKPELALLNGDGDRISKDIDLVRSRPFVGEEFKPVRINWFADYAAEIKRQTRVTRNDNSVLVERLPVEKINVYAFGRTYRTIYLENLQKFFEAVKNKK